MRMRDAELEWIRRCLPHDGDSKAIVVLPESIGDLSFDGDLNLSEISWGR